MFHTDIFPKIQKIEFFCRMGLSDISGSKNTRRICQEKKKQAQKVAATNYNSTFGYLYSSFSFPDVFVINFKCFLTFYCPLGDFWRHVE